MDELFMPISLSEVWKLIENKKPEEVLDLSGFDMSGFDLQGANLAGANMTRCRLEGANLTDANLKGANLSLSALANAKFRKVDLTEANLQNSDLTGADFTDSTFVRVRIDHRPRFSRVIFDGALITASFDLNALNTAKSLKGITLERGGH